MNPPEKEYDPSSVVLAVIGIIIVGIAYLIGFIAKNNI
jgi:preprotein translocase subunit Sss1